MSKIEPKSAIAAAQAAEAALKALDEAWAYFTPQPLPVRPEPAQELFQYHNAA